MARGVQLGDTYGVAGIWNSSSPRFLSHPPRVRPTLLVQGDSRTFALFERPRHLEPALEGFRAFTKACAVQPDAVAYLSSCVPRPPLRSFRQGAEVVGLRTARPLQALRSWQLDESAAVFLCHGPVDVILIASWASRERVHRALTKAQDDGVERAWSLQGPILTRVGRKGSQAPSGGPYDPLTARVREILRVVIPDCVERLQELRARCERAARDVEAEAGFHWILFHALTYEEALRIKQRELARLVRTSPPNLLQLADDAAGDIVAATSFLSEAEQLLSPWEPSAAPRLQAPVEAPTLRAAQRVTEDVHLAIRRLMGPRIAVVAPGPFGGGERLATSLPWSDKEGRGAGEVWRVGFPYSQVTRIGAHPLLAHEVARIGLWSNPTVWIGPLFRFHESPGRPAWLPRLPEADQEPAGKSAALHLATLAADVVAAAIMGPAYLYAFARFVTEPASEVHLGSTRAGMMVARLALCAATLDHLGTPYHFRSSLLEEMPRMEPPRALLKALLAPVEQPYGAAHHKRAVGSVQRELLEGRIPAAPPRVILNALWDAVIHKKGYANEAAALAGILQSKRRIPAAIPILQGDTIEFFSVANTVWSRLSARRTVPAGVDRA